MVKDLILRTKVEILKNTSFNKDVFFYLFPLKVNSQNYALIALNYL